MGYQVPKRHKKADHVKPGQVWRDEFGEFRLMAVEEGWVMARRASNRPFTRSTNELISGSKLTSAGASVTAPDE